MEIVSSAAATGSNSGTGAGAGTQPAPVLKPTSQASSQDVSLVKKAGSATSASASDTAVAPTRGPSFQIVSLQNHRNYFKGLIYAEYGVGKTYLAGTAIDVPAMRDVILINAESGQLTLDDDAHDFHLIDSVRVKDYKTVARFYEFLKLHCSLRDREGPEAEAKLWELQNRLLVSTDASDMQRLRRYQTVIIDSLTEVEAYCMNQLLNVNDATKIDDEVQGAEWAEYKKQHLMVQRLIRNFRDLPMNVIFTCARQYQQDEMKRHIYSPMMTGKLAGHVQGFMDMVGYLVLGAVPEDGSPTPRRMYIQPSPRFAAKSRFSRYKQNFFDNPTIGSIMVDVGLLEKEQVERLPTKSNRPASPTKKG